MKIQCINNVNPVRPSSVVRRFTPFWLSLTLVGMGIFCCWSQARAGTIDLVLNGVNWGTNFYAPASGGGPGKDGLPDDSLATSPVWTNVGDSKGTITLASDHLSINTTTSGYNYRDFYGHSLGSAGTNNATVEFTAKVNSTASSSVFAGGVYAGTGCYTWSLQFGNKSGGYALQWGGVNYTSAQLGGADFSEETTFRIVMENMTNASALATLYVNNNSTPLLTLNATTMTQYSPSILYFGQTAKTGNQAGDVDWYGIRWAEAAYPVPEPGTLAGLLLGLGTLVLCSRRRRAAEHPQA